MRWIGPFPVPKKRINATNSAAMRTSILALATMYGKLELATMALQCGADINQLDAHGGCALEEKCMMPEADRDIQLIKLLKEWGGEIIGNSAKKRREISLMDEKNRDAIGEFLPKMMDGIPRALLGARGFAKCQALFDDPLVARRCEIVNLSGNNSHLNGRVGVVVKYLEGYDETLSRPAMGSDRFKFVFENSKEACVARRENLKRRDRTPLDCGYWLTYKKGRFERKTFKTSEECRAYVTSLARGKSANEVTIEIDPEAEIKADEAAAELLAELGLDDSAANFHQVNRKPKARGKKKEGEEEMRVNNDAR
ncbi:hypothetical protein THAOC_36384 [Thalassiosira oceanica]|uniref:Uncharacterized protein n=1 Tax=Thalassiosira oceanica TaxID=159749 RepID=K0R1Y4_THAOC|nr:hypothetical protein THAOC_36384 [Thalassiosira oceanica]|eukprot:EJK45029.1 hypothetical protein THAOC_36384 [Thalassiosira oceanica]